MYSFSMKTCTAWIFFQRWVIIESKAEGRVPDYVLGRKYTYIRARARACSLINKILLYGVFFLVPPVSRIPASRENAYRKYGWKLRNDARNVVSWGERTRMEGEGGGGEEEKKKKKICGTKEKASHRVGRLWKMRCQEYCCVGSRRPSQVFTGTLWNSFERMKLLSNGPLQPTDDMQPTGLESN